MHSEISEFLIFCSYCDKCYGEYANQQKQYFSPIKIIPEKEVSHGICPECFKKIEDLAN